MRIIITAGPTREPLDPVRFLTNHSTGKMGFAIASAAAERGHDVVLVSGPVHLPEPPGVAVVRVETAGEMHEAVRLEAPTADAFIMTAAVADLRPVNRREQKLKKEQLPTDARGHFHLELERTPDICREVNRWRRPGSLLVGFAAETNDHRNNARRKLREKHCDLILLNDVSRADIGFGSDHNELQVIYPDGRTEPWPRQSKNEIAGRLMVLLEELRQERDAKN
jgi:phosphopantothenoylcysteine synthetase/decarboxylase